jgi:hypothetical protein
MNKYIANSTASNPLGFPTGEKCLILKSGQYSKRIAILYASSAANITLVWADAPYESFSTPVIAVTDSADSPFDAYINDAGDIYIAYTIAGSNNLGFVKLTFGDGSWSIGSPVTVYDGDDNYFPSIYKLSPGYLWIAYTRVSKYRVMMVRHGGQFQIPAIRSHPAQLRHFAKWWKSGFTSMWFIRMVDRRLPTGKN